MLTTRPAPQSGFTLVEMAIVLIIVGLLISGIVVSIGAQQENGARSTTEKKLAEATEAILGFATANNRLPCPASAVSSGAEAFCIESLPGPCTETLVVQAHGRCSSPYTGFLPGRTLGLSPVDNFGRAMDSWGNPIGYAVTTATTNAFTSINGMKTNWIIGGLSPDLRICNTGVGIAGGNCINAGATSADTAVAVLYSRARNGAVAPASVDEVANGDNDRVFVSHPPTPLGNVDEFDDIVVWLSPNILYSRMIVAGRLP